MIDKNYREVQFSSSHLILIFVGILILGVVIFLLGVSVGKKQAQIIKKTEMPVPAAVTQPKEAPPPSPSPSPQQKDLIDKEVASHQKVMEETQKKAPLSPKKDIFYIQVGAFDTKEGALSFAKEFEKKGYSTIVLDPLPTDRKPFYRVRIGGFDTLEKAEEVKARLKSETKRKVDYFITKS